MSLARVIDRRLLITTIVALGGSGGTALGGVPPRRSATLTCATFLDILGVNTHLRDDRSPYADIDRVAAAIDLLGVGHARDAAVDMTAPSSLRYAALADRGVRFCMLLGPRRPIDETLTQVAAFEAAHPGAVEVLEGPNEIKPDFAYGARFGTEAAVRVMADLRAAATRHGLRAKPLVAFTGYARAASDCDFANVHLYPRNGSRPGPLFDEVLERWSGPAGVMPGRPLMVTEMGFHTLLGPPGKPGQWRGVDEETQAILAIDAWIAAATAGVAKLYLYELLDGGVDGPAGASMQRHFGLFRADGSPKPAAIAIGALTRLLAAGATTARAATRTPIDIRIAGAPSLSWLTLRAADGVTFVLFRNDAPVWTPGLDAPAPAHAATARITLSSPAPMAAWDLVANRPYTSLSPSRSASFSVARAPIAVRIG